MDNEADQTSAPNLRPIPAQECEWAQRNLAAYVYSLFPDADYQPQNVQEVNEAGFQYAGPSTPDDESIRATFQGIEGFFRPGAAILDIGSGSGRATDEMIETFAPKGVTIIGLDLAYSTEPPRSVHTDAFVAGSWDNMPLPNDTFTGLLSSESFPTHAWIDSHAAGHERNERTIAEITRVAKQGAVWRATASALSGLPNRSLTEMLLSNGWEVYAYPGLVIARLINK